MKSLDVSFLAALGQARERGLVPAQLLWLRARDRATGAPAEFGFWTRDETLQAEVISAETGMPVLRTFVGGVNLKLGEIVHTSDLTIPSVVVTMSQIADAAQIMLRGADCRLATVEIYDALLEVAGAGYDGGGLVAAPRPSFLGLVDEAPLVTPAAGGEGSISLTLRSEAIAMLARVNPRRSSAQGQAIRSGDQWGRYASTVATWSLKWGAR